jgi:hypothetical protein
MLSRRAASLLELFGFIGRNSAQARRGSGSLDRACTNRLVNIVPRPRHASWAADYPYPVARAGHPIEAPGCELNRGADVLFQVASAWRNSRGQFLAGLDTKSGFHNPTPIDPDERWQMTYEVTADNAKPLKFLLEMLVQGEAVAMKRKS